MPEKIPGSGAEPQRENEKILFLRSIGREVNLLRPRAQTAMPSAVVVIREKLAQIPAAVRHVLVVLQVHLLLLHRPPQAFDHDVVEAGVTPRSC